LFAAGVNDPLATLSQRSARADGSLKACSAQHPGVAINQLFTQA